MNCLYCESDNLRNKGYSTRANGVVFRRYHCKDCGEYSSYEVTPVAIEPTQPEEKKPSKKSIEAELTELGDYVGIVVTSAMNDTALHKPFFNNLVRYCDENRLRLFVIKNKYNNPSLLNSQQDVTYPPELVPYFLDTTFRYKDKFKVIGDCNIIATASHPLTGIDGLTEGITTIVGHPVMQMLTLPVNEWKSPVIMHSTGSVSMKNNYSASKAGYRASFHHCWSALVIEIDAEDDFHIRQLCATQNGSFYDLNEHWDEGGVTYDNHIDAIVTGDEHSIFRDEDVERATYGYNGIVDRLKPKYIIRGDVFDGHSISHHHTNDFFTQYKKHIVESKYGNLQHELDDMVEYIGRTTPPFAQSLLVYGNHESHLDKWLNVADPKKDLVNAKLYHKLMYDRLENMEEGKSTPAVISYIAKHLEETVCKPCPEGFTIHGVLLSEHGDKGPNGARGSAQNLSKIGEKSILGHSHCLTDDHSALTQTGWKKVYNIDVGELVLTYDYTTKSNVWLPNKKTHVMQHSGKLVNINTNNIQQSVTPNHMLSLSDGRYINVCEAITTEMPALIPVSACNRVTNPNIIEVGLSDLELKKIVAFCADGHVSFTDNGSPVYRFHIKKSRKIDRLYEFFGKDYTPMSAKNFGKTGSTKISIAAGTESYNFLKKWIPMPKRLPEFFRTLSPSQKEVVIDELKYWDGTFDTGTNARQYSTAKLEEVDLISSILVELGYRTSVINREFHKNRNHAPSFVITWNHDKNMHTGPAKASCQPVRYKSWGVTITTVDNIRVSCLETDNKNFWVRNDKYGKVSLTGNSPKIIAGTFQVGTSSKLKLEYNKGPSSWMHTHCILHKNGKRQMINIINGKWHS
jgi:hypothetical protein